MGLFSGLDANGTVEVEEEKLGGGGMVKDTGSYDFVVEMAYGGVSAGGAYFIDVKLKTESGQFMTVKEYITSGTEKGVRPYYIDKEGKQKALPGYSKMNALDILLTGNEAQYPATETKTIMLYNYDAEKDVPTEVEVVTGWIGKPITGLVRAVREFKRVQNEKKQWVESTETKDTAEVIHFVDSVTGQTRSEKMTNKDATVKPQFDTKYDENYVLDKTKGKGKAPSKGGTPAPEVGASPFGAK